MLLTHAFGNFIPKGTKYLLLGSFTANSLGTDPEYDWFYGSKRNQFWSIMEEVYALSLPDKKSRMGLFLHMKMGIADIIHQCERANDDSLDTSLINIVYNPELINIISSNKIHTIFFSSRFVENKFKKFFKSVLREYSDTLLITLPSPSPRYALMTKQEKILRYKELLPKC